jgi:hypothetical protein
MCLALSLRPTTFDDGPCKDDYVVIWTSRQYRRHKIGRIMRNDEQQSWTRQEAWAWPVTAAVGNGIKSGYGQATSLDKAKQRFRRAFAREELETPDRLWSRAYECRPARIERGRRRGWKRRFRNPSRMAARSGS